MNNFLQLAKDRYSVRSFKDMPVEQEKIDKIIEAAIVAPTACNNQPFKIWVAKSEDAKSKINKANSFPFAQSAPVLIVVGANSSEGWVRGYDGKSFAEVDAAIAATHIMLAAHSLGLGSTWIGHFDEKILKQEFEDMKDYSLIAILPIGYIAKNSEPARTHSVYKDRDLLVKEL